MRKMKFLLFAFSFIILTNGLKGEEHLLHSPDSRITVKLIVEKQLSFAVSYDGQYILDNCGLGMTIDAIPIGKDARLKKLSRRTVDKMIQSVVPIKNAMIRDHFNEMRLTFKGAYSLVFRAYNEGVSYRFELEGKKNVVVNEESLHLNFVGENQLLYPQESSFISHYERYYVDTTLSALATDALASLPILVRNANDVNMVITEADLYDYPGMFMRAQQGNSLKADFPKFVKEAKSRNGNSDRNQSLVNADYLAETSGERHFPWRLLVITDDDRKLLENTLVFQLSRPLIIDDPSWIKPGKVAWDWWNDNNITDVDFEAGINNETYKYYIDFASTYGLDYIILDEGWSKSTTNVQAYAENIDVEELVSYGKDKGVGIILWVLWEPLDKNMDVILDLYQSWGVQGIKVDFMQRADQYMVNYYENVARAASKRELVVDFHGAFKPSGLRRAYPNVLSYEGLRGQEQCKWIDKNTAKHNLQLPFIRMLAGPMDYTPGAMDNALQKNFYPRWSRPMSMGTRCHQLAMYVIYESPLQMLCDSPSNYYKEAESTAFISKIPTVWDETRVLEASVGEYIVIARRKGSDWYMGAMTDDQTREFEIDFSFLEKAGYDMEIMQDGANAHRHAEDYKRIETTITSQDKMTIKLAAEGGWAAILQRK